MRSLILAMAVLGASSAPAPAQAQAEPSEVSEVSEVIVQAQRSGAPIWIVTRDGSTLILVGSISGIPADVTWRPDDLQAAASASDLVLTAQEGRVSPMDILRIVWRMRTINGLPSGRSHADYLSPDWHARLERVMAGRQGDNWCRRSMLMLGFDLIQEGAGYGFGRQSPNASEVVRRAARRAGVETRPVGTVRGDDMVDSLVDAPQETHVPCVQAAIVAAEAGSEAARRRAISWRARNVPDAIASPIDAALSRCWPWADADLAPVLHQQWTEAIETALSAPRVTLATAPLRLLAEEGGILDRLERRGLAIEGPEWRADRAY